MFRKDNIRKVIELRELVKQKTENRLAFSADENRKDFVIYILYHNSDNKGITYNEIIVNFLALIITYNETTAIILSGLIYYLIKIPEVYQKLINETLTAFSPKKKHKCELYKLIIISLNIP